ncbi:MAG: sulfite exporter TauE/SafE family protein [Candidatus Bipolaricaulia bacterium]
MSFEIGTFLPLFFSAIGIGVLASLLGLGGGVFMTPLLLLGGFVATQPDAAGTSVLAVVFTGISASIAYYRRRGIDFRIGLLFMPSALAGVVLGTWIVRIAEPSWLITAFGLFLLYPMAMMLFGKTPKELRPIARRGASGIRFYVLIAVLGLLAGTATKLFGIGGGTVFVPSLVMFLGFDIVTAVATSLFVMVPTAIASSLTSWFAGTLHLELAVPLVLGIIIGAQIGPRIGARAPKALLLRLFGLALLYAAVSMILKGLR